MKNEIIQALLDAYFHSADYVSGEAISRRFGVSRAAVSKAIQSLAAAGLPIESVKHHGYRLSHLPDLLIEPIISDTLRRSGVSHFATTVHAWPVVDSTNLAARRGVESGDHDGSLYIAEEQTAGRGRRGKSWLSQSGDGLWFSLLMIPDLAPEAMARITLFAGLCTATALRGLTGLDVQLKWPNDLVVMPEGKKLGGILTEMMVEENRIAAVIIGIGINVNTGGFPETLQPVATSIKLALEQQALKEDQAANPVLAHESQRIPARVELLAAILSQFERRWPGYDRKDEAVTAISLKDQASGDLSAQQLEPAWLADYRSICATIGRPVFVVDALGQSREGQAVTVASSGDLRVRWLDGSETAVSAGEVSVRGLLGYV